MVQLEADLLLAPEPVETGGVALNLQIRHLDGDGFAGLAIIGLEQGGHPALGNDVGDLEPVIQHRPHPQVSALGHRASWRRRAYVVFERSTSQTWTICTDTLSLTWRRSARAIRRLQASPGWYLTTASRISSSRMYP